MRKVAADPGPGPTAGERIDEAEFARRYQACYRTLWAIAAGVLGSPVAADDVCQDAALIGLSKLDGFEPGTNFVAWMGQIVRHTARNTGRRQARRRAAPLDAAGEAPACPPVDDAPGVDVAGRLRDGQEAFDDRVVASLNELGETARACLLLRTVVGCDYAHIGLVLGIPEGTAMSHVHRARKRMRASLREGGAG